MAIMVRHTKYSNNCRKELNFLKSEIIFPMETESYDQTSPLVKNIIYYLFLKLSIFKYCSILNNFFIRAFKKWPTVFL